MPMPFVVSSTAHQRDNAHLMARHAAAIHLPQQELSAETLAAILHGMTRDMCLDMAQSAWVLGKRDANQKIADVIEELSRSPK